MSQPDYEAKLSALVSELRQRLIEALKPGWFGEITAALTIKDGRVFELRVGDEHVSR